MTDTDTTRIDPAELDGTVAYLATGNGLTIARLSTDGAEELARIRCGAVADVDVGDRLCFATSEDVFLLNSSE